MSRPRRGQSKIIFAKSRNREGAMRTFNDIICRTGCSSLTILKVLMDKIKSFN